MVCFIVLCHTKASLFGFYFFGGTLGGTFSSFTWGVVGHPILFWCFNTLRGCVSPSRVTVKQNHIPSDPRRSTSRAAAHFHPMCWRPIKAQVRGKELRWFSCATGGRWPAEEVKRVNGVTSRPQQLDQLRTDSNTRTVGGGGRGVGVGHREVWTLFFILFMHSRRGKALAVLFVAAPLGAIQDSTADHKAAKRANLQTHYSDLH